MSDAKQHHDPRRRSDSESFGTFGTFGTGKSLQQFKTDHERVLSLRAVPDGDDPHNDDANEGRRIVAAVKAATASGA